MSNPPAGWYPDPTGQPNTIRWWNGTQWTSKTEKEVPHPDPTTTASPASTPAVTPVENSPTASTPVTPAEKASTPAVTPAENASTASTPAENASDPALTPAEKAKSTWMAPTELPAAANHWTQRPLPPADAEPITSAEPTAAARPERTLKLASSSTGTTPDPAPEPQAESGPTTNWSQSPTPAPTPGADTTQQIGGWGQTANLPTNPEPRVTPDEETPPAQSTPDPQSPAPANNTAPQWGPTATQQPAANNWSNPNPQQTNTGGWADPNTQQASAGGWADPNAQQANAGGWGRSGSRQTGAAAPGSPDAQSAGAAGWNAAGVQGASGGQWGSAQAVGQQQTGDAAPWQGAAGQQGGGTRKGKDSGGSGGTNKTPLIIGGVVTLVILIVVAVFLITNSGNKTTADPSPTPQPTDAPTTPATTTPGTEAGQSKNPKLHEGPNRISSDAISFPRQSGEWSDRKRLIPQLLNSSGQYVVLQRDFDGSNDWYAEMFVGRLGNATPFGGNLKTTATSLLVKMQKAGYGNIPVTFKTLSSGEVKRSDKAGWYIQQTVTAKSPKITSVLILTVAVFDLGDGTAVAYISDIPTNRPDLRKAESQVYKGINVG